MLLVRKQQELFEFAAKEFRARRVVEGEGGECVEHAVVAGIAPVQRFDADDRDDHLFRHAELGARPRE